MEIDLNWITHDANVYDVRKSIELALHGPDLYDPNDNQNKGRKPNFQIVMGQPESANRLHNGTAILRVNTGLGLRFLRWIRDSDDHNVVVCGCPLRISNAHRDIPLDVKLNLEKALHISSDKDRLYAQKEDYCGQARLRIAKIQFGVWYRNQNAPQNRAFSIEYEREVLRPIEAHIAVAYDQSLMRIDIEQENNLLILVKFESIRKFVIGHDRFGKPFIIFDLFAPPVFEQTTFNNRALRDRISALDDAHAAIAPYAHHLRIVLADHDDLRRFEQVCQVAECEPRPVRIAQVNPLAKNFFSRRELDRVQRWIDTMDWKIAFQIEAYLRCGLLNTHDLRTLQIPIENVIHDYSTDASALLRLFAVELKTRQPDEHPNDCLARVRTKHPTLKPLLLAPGFVSCHYVIITPSRILLEGPYATQSNRVVRRYQERDPALVERFIRVEFREEDHQNYRWGRNVDSSSFLHQRVGGILRNGFTLGGRSFEYLAYSTSSLREHSFWFMTPFRDPEEGYVTAEKIRTSLGDFSRLLRTPSKYAARMAQAFTATDPSVTINRDQWEEQPELGPHTDGVGTMSPRLAAMIWEAKCTGSGIRDRVEPSAYQFRFLGYKGVVVVDHQLEGIRMRLRESQCKFPALTDEVAEFEIARAFDCPNPAQLNRPVVMALEDRGAKKSAFIDLLENAKARIYMSSDSLKNFAEQLRDQSMGGQYGLPFIIEQLTHLGLDFRAGINKTAIGRPFFESILRYSMSHSLREVKFKARIPVPNSYQLVGVADEGRAYINEGLEEDNVFTLKPGRIYVCVQESVHSAPVFLKGACLISRSPVIHPGDIQRVYAIGEPPEDKICFFRGLKNVVVFPAVGDRSMASCLSGGDLDGDTYDIYHANLALLPTIQADPAPISTSSVWSLADNEPDATIDDICKFIVEYMNSDVMGMLANWHIIIADQSKDGVFDERCMRLADLCGKTLDYAKNGVPVDIHNRLPRPLIKLKPDWDKKEVTGTHEPEYYESDRALGYMFRSIMLRDLSEPIEGFPVTPPGTIVPLEDPISLSLSPLVRTTLNANANNAPGPPAAEIPQPEKLHALYESEMRYICVTHTLVDAPGVSLKEEEVVLGTILANTTQHRWRSDRAFRLRLHSAALVRDIRSQIIRNDNENELTVEERHASLSVAWEMWCWAQHHQGDKEYIESFSLIVLRIVLDLLTSLGALPQA